MSQHIVEDGKFKYVFGWDQPLESFYLQKHNLELMEEVNPVVWLTPPSVIMYEVEDLVRQAKIHGLHIDSVMQKRLYAEKDGGA